MDEGPQDPGMWAGVGVLIEDGCAQRGGTVIKVLVLS